MRNGLNSLDAQINDYLLIASGHLHDAKPAVDVRQLAAFGAAASSALVMMSQAEAAIVYTTPGTPPSVAPSPAFVWTSTGTGATSTAPIDLNGGGADFQLFAFGGSQSSTGESSAYAHYPFAGLMNIGGNRLIGGSSIAYRLANGAQIGPSATWLGGTGGAVFYTTYWDAHSRVGLDGWDGHVAASNTGLVGVQFAIGANTHYGWIRLHAGTNVAELSATEWAYEACHDQPIAAGATTGGTPYCDPPVNTVPGAQTIASGIQTAITGLSVTDTGNNLVSTRLTVTSGALHVTLSGAAIGPGANNSATLTLTGTQAQINATLGTLQFTGTTSTILTVLSTDAAGATDSDTVTITVNALPSAPMPIPILGPVAYGLTSLAMLGLGLGDLRRRRRMMPKAEDARH